MIFKKIKNHFYEKRKAKSDAFIASLSTRSIEFLKEAYIDLDGISSTQYANEFTNKEARAVAEEMDRRGLQYQYDY